MKTEMAVEQTTFLSSAVLPDWIHFSKPPQYRSPSSFFLFSKPFAYSQFQARFFDFGWLHFIRKGNPENES